MRNKDIPLTNLQRQMLLGSLLGDACVWRAKPTFNSYIKIDHSARQKEYVWWKYEMLKNIVSAPPRECNTSGNSFEGNFRACRFATRSLPCITELHELVGKKKEITQKWLDEINHPIALATWLMDDGCCSPNGPYGYRIKFCTGNRNAEELELLQSWLAEWIGIDAVIIYIPNGFPNKTELKIHRNAAVRSLEELVRPYLIPSMQYKLPPLERPLVSETRADGWGKRRNKISTPKKDTWEFFKSRKLPYIR